MRIFRQRVEEKHKNSSYFTNGLKYINTGIMRKDLRSLKASNLGVNKLSDFNLCIVFFWKYYYTVIAGAVEHRSKCQV